MSPLEELEAANLSREQTAYFIGHLAYILDSRGDITPEGWTAAIKGARA